jgi:4-hydroxy-4-methyl-2-oxoglutarate aldolase
MTGLLDRLRSVDTCALSDALDRLGKPGAVAGIGPVTGTSAVAGRVVTVELAPARGAVTQTPPRHLATAAVAASGPGDVIVVSHPGGTMAGWGGLLSLAAAERGVEGTLVDGPCRDVDESRAIGYSMFAPGVTPITARGRLVEAQWGGPIQFAGVRVSLGDLVLADGSGIVFVPHEMAEAVLALAAELTARESAMAAAVRGGRPVTEVMGPAYEQLSGSGACE